MAPLVWLTMGIALWHFTIWLPDRFWSGIVGAFLGAIAGAMVSGAVVLVVQGHSIGQTNVSTALAAVPGTLIGLVIVYLIGVSRETKEA